LRGLRDGLLDRLDHRLGHPCDGAPLGLALRDQGGGEQPGAKAINPACCSAVGGPWRAALVALPTTSPATAAPNRKASHVAGLLPGLTGHHAGLFTDGTGHLATSLAGLVRRGRRLLLGGLPRALTGILVGAGC
jgi:hypothetical protein